MRRFRFHLGTLVMLVLFVGVGLAALRESNENWDSGIFSLTLAVLLISILLAIHRTEKRRAFWMGFALFGWTYLGLSLVPSIESRLITTKAFALLDSKVQRSITGGLAYFDYDNDGAMDLYVVNNTQSNALLLNKGNGDWIEDVTAATGSNPTRFTNILAGRTLTGFGTTEKFIRIGHSLAAMILALLGGHISRRLFNDYREVVEEATTSQGTTSS
jgi:FG-GAP-like repeat